MMNVMIVTNSRYLKPTVVMLYSLFLQEQGEVTVYLAYEDLTDQELEGLRRSQHIFLPQREESACAADYRQWRRAVERARAWAETD